MADTEIDACKSASRCLGLPLFSSCTLAAVTSPEVTRSMIQETQSSSFMVPVAGMVSESQLAQRVASNGKLLAALKKPIAPMSRNWVLDAETADCQFRDDEMTFSPATVIVDEISDLDNLPSSVESIVYDISSFSQESLKRLTERSLELNVPVSLRFVVPEIGPVAALVPIAEFTSKGLSALQPVDGVELDIRENTMYVRAAVGGYLGRPGPALEDGWLRTLFSATERTDEPKSSTGRNRKIMQPDWRVRKVPMAVYHKKRGFKGQIYYTTKHKGWSFYRSRYYN